MESQTIKQLKLEKAEKAFDAGISVYGSIEARLRSLDCKSREEAIKMLAVVQEVRVYKVDGIIVME